MSFSRNVDHGDDGRSFRVIQTSAPLDQCHPSAKKRLTGSRG